MRLGVNIDHVATIRQARRTTEPDPVLAAQLAEQAGADSIVCHLREDRRHVQDRDLRLLRQTVQTRLNLEMALSEEILAIAIEVKPDEATIVPERRQEVTTEGGLDVVGSRAVLTKAIPRLRAAGIAVSLFIDPDPAPIREAAALGVGVIELHTGAYAHARGDEARGRELRRLREATDLARSLSLTVAAGHGLTYPNVRPVAAIPGIEELNIGHSIISRAVFAGIESAVREMRGLLAHTS